MKILYAIQGTGNGHISRAIDIVPCLRRKAEVDVLLSGTQADLSLPFTVKYKMHGLSFIFGRRGGVDYYNTFMKNTVRSVIREIRSLPVEDYDLVVNDFEPISAWACRLKKQPIVSLSHQSAILSEFAPKPRHRDMLGSFFLNYYAPAERRYGFHFKAYDKQIFTPVIRRQVREEMVSDKGHYTVYLPAYDDAELLKHLRCIAEVNWEVFSKHNSGERMIDNVHIQPINNEKFIKSMASSSGVLCGAGFETPAECLFMNKKLMVIPMKNQYEQHFNAAALQSMGVPVIKELTVQNHVNIREWVRNGRVIGVNYPEVTEDVVELILSGGSRSEKKDVLPANIYG